MQITILGCGPSAGVPMIGCDCAVCTSSNPKNRRLRASILIALPNGKTLLVDASPDLRQQALNHNIRSIDVLLLTHAHADHCHGLDEVRSFNYHRGSAIDLYADNATMQEVQQRFAYVFTPHHHHYGWYKPEFTCHSIQDGVTTHNIADTNVTLFPQQHGKVISLGLRIGNIAYSTDVNAFDAASFEQLRGLDVWIVDCLRHEPAPTHAHLNLTLSWIKELQPKRAILTHMGHEFDYDVLNRQLPPHVEMAYDGMVITL